MRPLTQVIIRVNIVLFALQLTICFVEPRTSDTTPLNPNHVSLFVYVWYKQIFGLCTHIHKSRFLLTPTHQLTQDTGSILLFLMCYKMRLRSQIFPILIGISGNIFLLTNKILTSWAPFKAKNTLLLMNAFLTLQLNWWNPCYYFILIFQDKKIT